jgi:tricorn protease
MEPMALLLRLKRTWTGGLLAALLLGFSAAAVADETRLLRFPAIHGDRVVFSYAGDLYLVSAQGGVARRLTSDVGYEMFARFSPDGEQLAFTAQYDGNTEVYLMPAEGGVPRRLTYTATLDRDDVADRMGPNNIVMAWRDNSTIVFRSRRIEWNAFNGQLFLIPTEGGLPEQLPLPRGAWCSFSPEGSRMAYNRVFREFRTWKRYRGGMADDIWIHDFQSRETINLTDHPAQDIFPMWHENRIYFVSDRDERQRMNLYVHHLDSGQVETLTRFTEFDVKFPSLGDSSIVFENGGHLYRLDLASHQLHPIPVRIQEDLAVGRDGLKDVSKSISSYDIAPDGARATFGARGDVFTVPATQGPTRNLTRSSGIHEREGQWSPNGRWIAFISDRTGEDEIYIMPQDGREPAKQLTTGGDTYKYSLSWSPDSRYLLWSDKMNRLQFIDVHSQGVTMVDDAAVWEITQYAWSPDSRWIAFTRPEERQFPRVALYSIETGQWQHVTDEWFASAHPEFSQDGKLLFFVSSRDFRPRYSQTEWNHSYFDMQRIFFVTLTRDVQSPLQPRSDEVSIKEKTTEIPSQSTPDVRNDHGSDDDNNNGQNGDEKTDEKKKSKENDDPSKVKVTVDFEGLQQRIAALPISASSYRALTSVGQKLYYLRDGLRDNRSRLLMFDLDPEKRKETDLGEFNGYRVSANGKKMLVDAGNRAYAIVDLPSSRIEIKEHLDLGHLQVMLDRRAEWNQIYAESWRQMRDFTYDPNLHRVDWPRMRQRYEPLLRHVQHRADLTYVIGELIGELNLGHAYVGGGDTPDVPRVKLGLLGARIERDPASGTFVIREILPGQNWDDRVRSPLTEIGVDAREGDHILAIDGQPTTTLQNLYAALINKAGRQVRLTLSADPEGSEPRETTVVPIDDEQPLYYLKWVQQNIRRVTEATNGRVGYVHIPDMGATGLNEFVKYFYPQLRKEALLVDVRGNGGGNVSPQIIERLRREPVMITIARNGAVNFDPGGMVAGPKVMLLNEFSASDGDIVAYRFRQHGIGPIVGKRSWGGVVGIRGSLPLLDGGTLNRPEFSRYDLEGKEWIMEGTGVEPDVVVDNDPAREFDGIDDQLEVAIEIVLRELEEKAVPLVPPPPYPDKS